jgi:hypothetical protein
MNNAFKAAVSSEFLKMCFASIKMSGQRQLGWHNNASLPFRKFLSDP